MFGALSNWSNARAQAQHARAMADMNERIARENYDMAMRGLRLMGRTFKCGPWRWRIGPKHADAHGRPLSPEIKVTWLRA